MSEREFRSKLKEAKERVLAMDSIDGSPDRNIATIAEALVTGVLKSNEECTYEALYMLLDVSGDADHKWLCAKV